MFKKLLKRRFPLGSPVYIRHYSERYTGTIAGYSGWTEVLVRTSPDKVMVFKASSATLVEDEPNAEV